jgi:hypothetical protein
LDHIEPPLLGYAVLTNYQNCDTGKDDLDAWDEFASYYWEELRPIGVEITMAQRIGNWRAMKAGDEAGLRNMLEARKPADAIIGKAIELFNTVANRPAAGNTIGKQLSVLTIHAISESGSRVATLPMSTRMFVTCMIWWRCFRRAASWLATCP